MQAVFFLSQSSSSVYTLYDASKKLRPIGCKIYRRTSVKATLSGWGFSVMNSGNLPSRLALALADQYSTFVPPRAVGWRVEIRFAGGGAENGRVATGGAAAGGGGGARPCCGTATKRVPSRNTCKIGICGGRTNTPIGFGCNGGGGGAAGGLGGTPLGVAPS